MRVHATSRLPWQVHSKLLVITHARMSILVDGSFHDALLLEGWKECGKRHSTVSFSISIYFILTTFGGSDCAFFTRRKSFYSEPKGALKQIRCSLNYQPTTAIWHIPSYKRVASSLPIIFNQTVWLRNNSIIIGQGLAICESEIIHRFCLHILAQDSANKKWILMVLFYIQEVKCGENVDWCYAISPSFKDPLC